MSIEKDLNASMATSFTFGSGSFLISYEPRIYSDILMAALYMILMMKKNLGNGTIKIT
jgi:hypothetical protein